eukprot:3890277-Alexandrium_andersonii.AAC.1
MALNQYEGSRSTSHVNAETAGAVAKLIPNFTCATRGHLGRQETHRRITCPSELVAGLPDSDCPRHVKLDSSGTARRGGLMGG